MRSSSLRSYPREGHRLAPAILRDVLNVPAKCLATDIQVRLCDLDESAWDKFNGKVCRQLAREIVDRVQTHMAIIRSSSYSHHHLPPLPPRMQLGDLPLEKRTYNCLVGYGGLDPSTNRFDDRTLRHLIDLRGFGAKGMVDLLTSLESVRARSGLDLYPPPSARGSEAPVIEPQLLEELKTKAEALKSSKYASIILPTDVRLGDQIRSIDSEAQSVLDLSERLVNGKLHSSYEIKERIEAIEQLQQRLRGITELSVEDELKDLVRAVGCGERDASIFVSYFGWDGRGGANLKEIGSRFGLTRERIRQIRNKQNRRFQARSRSFFAPALDKALSLTMNSMPCLATEIERGLLEQGITDSRFQPSGLLRAARILRRDTFVIEEIDGSDDHAVVPTSRSGLTKAIVRRAKKVVRHWGVATVEDITSRVTDERPCPVDENFVVQVLESRHDFHWLDQGGGWFWLESVASTRLANRLEKVLSVAKRIHVSELRICIRRDITMEGVVPTQRLLLELCRQLPEYTVEGDYIVANQALRWENVLDENEMILVLVLEEEGPALQRDDFEGLCLSLGMNRNTFRRYLSHSPVVVRLAYMVYGLPGADIDAAIVESLIPERKIRKVLEDYGWTDDERIWLGFKMSHSMVRDGLFTVPAAMRRILLGSFELTTVDGARLGSVTIQTGGAWGLGPYFRRRGGEPGDVLVLRFDLSNREALAEIGDESLIEDLQRS